MNRNTVASSRYRLAQRPRKVPENARLKRTDARLQSLTCELLWSQTVSEEERENEIRNSSERLADFRPFNTRAALTR